MSVELETPPKVEGLAIVLPPHLTENFEKARSQIVEYYGLSPDLPALVRLWMACATSWKIRGEFERAVLDIQNQNINPAKDDFLDEE